MAIRILIDGYNLIRKIPQLALAEQQDFSQGRKKLLEWMARYRRLNPGPVVVVFDGGQGCGLQEERDIFQGIQVIYSRRGETADDIIKKMTVARADRTLVITSDRDLAGYCLSRGAGVMGSAEFAQRVKIRLEGGGCEDQEMECPSSLGPQKKKGLSHRPSKKKKREMKYWGKV